MIFLRAHSFSKARTALTLFSPQSKTRLRRVFGTRDVFFLYERCAETSFVISNIVTSPLPPNITFNFASARILRLLAVFWRLLALMYSHNFLTTCPRAIGPGPVTASSSGERFIGFMRAGFAVLTIDQIM